MSPEDPLLRPLPVVDGADVTGSAPDGWRRDRRGAAERSRDRLAVTNGQATWNVTDWRTGDTIAEGVGDYDAYGEAGQRLDPDGKWFHIDRIDHIENPQVDPTGVPTSLAEALQEWLSGLDTPDEDVAAVVGRSVKEAARHREGG